MDPEKGNPNPLLGFARMAVALKQKRISEAMADGADSIADGEMPDGVPDGIRARPGIHEVVIRVPLGNSKTRAIYSRLDFSGLDIRYCCA